MSSKSGEMELFAELKSFKDPTVFNKKKAEQVVNCVADSNSKAVFFLFCRDLTEDFAREKFFEWKNLGIIPSSTKLGNIILVVISDQTLLNCLVGFEQIPHSQLAEKFENFDKLLRLINKDFHGKLINLFPERPAVRVPIPSIEVEATPEIESQRPTVPEKPIPSLTSVRQLTLEESSYSQLLKELTKFNDTTFRTAIEVVKTLGDRKKVFTQRKITTVKNAIHSPLLKNSFDDAIEFLKQHHIIQEAKNSLKFNWDIFDKDDIKNDPKGLMIEIFKAVLTVAPEGG